MADDTGEILIEVVRGQARGPYQVDAVSGATRSSNAIGAMAIVTNCLILGRGVCHA